MPTVAGMEPRRSLLVTTHWSVVVAAGHNDTLRAQGKRHLLFKAAFKTPDGSLIINPLEFIRLVRAYRS